MRRMLAVTLTSLAIATGACTSGSDEGGAAKGPPGQVVAASAVKTTEAKSARAAFTLDLRGQSVPEDNATLSKGEGAVDFMARKASFTQTLPGAGAAGGGQVQTVVSTGTTAYVKLPPAIARAGGLGDKVWASIDIADLGQAPGAGLPSLTQATSSNPTQAVELMRGAVGDVTAVGKDKVRRDDTTHYKGAFDAAKAAEAAPPDQQTALRKFAQAFGGQALAADVWIDEQGRLRKLTYTLELSKLPAAPGVPAPNGTLDVAIEFYDFGVPVEANIPPADQVVDYKTIKAQRGR